MIDPVVVDPVVIELSPLILTVALNEPAASVFGALRSLHFPPALNIVPAHVTLFHHLPGEQLAAIAEELDRVCEAHAPIPVQVTGLRNLGRGVAFVLESAPFSAIRSELAAEWSSWLTLQDRQKFKPHITVQNKVQPQQARDTLALLQASFRPHTIEAIGLQLWHYRNGPWEFVRTFPFTLTIS